MRYRQTEKVELHTVPIFSPKYRELRPQNSWDYVDHFYSRPL